VRYLTTRTQKRPRCVVLSAISLDAGMSPGRGLSSREFGALIPKRYNKIRDIERLRADAIMVGSNTVSADNPKLISPNPNVIRVVIDSKGTTKISNNLLSDNFVTLFFVTSNTPKRFLNAIRTRNNKQFVVCGKNKVDLSRAFNIMYAMGIRKVLVEGGGLLINHLLKDKLVDEIKLLYLPTIVGERDAPRFGVGDENLFKKIKLKNKRCHRLKDLVFVEYSVLYDGKQNIRK
jgi:riboflavin-specific deaminase-like protein